VAVIGTLCSTRRRQLALLIALLVAAGAAAIAAAWIASPAATGLQTRVQSRRISRFRAGRGVLLARLLSLTLLIVGAAMVVRSFRYA
jgi:hypothetical protein